MTVEARILDLFAERATMTGAEMRQRLPDVKPGSVNSAIERLYIKGRIEQCGRGTWRVAELA